MRSIIWKELRENLRWAVAALAGAAVATLIGLHPIWKGLHLISYSHRAPLVSEEFLLAMGLATAASGLLLGFMQVILESRGDRWALLVHRPVSRSKILLGKVLAGLSLYLAASALPFLLASLWVATPGHIPGPFSAQMMLPGFVLITAGAAFYFAGILTAIRQARWYASRGLGIAVALIASLLVIAPRFWMAFSGALVVVAVLAVAAWGSFCSAGRYSSQPRASRAALGLSLLTGLILTGATLLGFLMAWLPQNQDRTYTHYALDREGRALRLTYGRFRPVTVSDLEGRAIEEYRSEEGKDLEPEKHLAHFTYLQLGKLGGPAILYWYHGGIVPLYSPIRRGAIRLYYVSGEGLIEVHDTRDVRRVGYIGPGQLAVSPRKPEERFQGDVRTLVMRSVGDEFLIFRDGVYRIATDEARLERIFDVSADDPVLAAGLLYAPGDGETPQEIGMITRRTLHILAPDGAPRLELRRRPEWEHCRSVGVARLDGGRYALWCRHGRSRTHAGGEELVEVVSANGVRESEIRLPPLERPSRNGPPEVLAGLFVPVGLVGGIAAMLSLTKGYEEALTLMPFIASWWLVMLLVGFVCAVVAYTITRRYAFSRGRRILWSLVGFVLGVPGLLTLLCAEEWPAREICDSCGKPRRVDRPVCELCQASWPAPADDGTEIFG